MINIQWMQQQHIINIEQGTRNEELWSSSPICVLHSLFLVHYFLVPCSVFSTLSSSSQPSPSSTTHQRFPCLLLPQLSGYIDEAIKAVFPYHYIHNSTSYHGPVWVNSDCNRRKVSRHYHFYHSCHTLHTLCWNANTMQATPFEWEQLLDCFQNN